MSNPIRPVGIREAISRDDIAMCHAVMQQLRPAFGDEQAFVSRVRDQMQTGYRLALAEDGGVARAVAGFRILHNLAWGRFMYVDDLVTEAASQGQGHGSLLFDWLTDLARQSGCGQLHLDSGVQRFAAHRFYLHKSMNITSHHFALDLT